MKKVSINRIAELAEVSKTTVSFVINGRGDEKNISQETQKRIKAIAKAHNYQANLIARSLSLGKSDTIAFIVPDISDPFFGKIARYIQTYAEKKGYLVMVASSDEKFEKEKKLLRSFKARQIDGIILASSANSYQEQQQITDKDLPIVFFDRIFDQQKESCVDINNSSATKELTQLLIDKGHKNIGLISLTSYLPNIKERISGYKKALKNNNIEFHSEYFYEIDYYNKKKEIKTALDQITQNKEPVTAIVFINNVLAAEAVWALNTYTPELVDKLQFACFDNLDLFDYSKPKVISILQPIEEIACNSFDILHKQIEEQKSSPRIELNATIIKR